MRKASTLEYESRERVPRPGMGEVLDYEPKPRWIKVRRSAQAIRSACDGDGLSRSRFRSSPSKRHVSIPRMVICSRDPFSS